MTILPWLAILASSSAHGAPASWGAVVARLTSPIEARWTRSEAEAALGAACDGGRRAACRLELGEGLASVLQEACVEGDDVACLGAAWLLQEERPEEAFSAFERLCSVGQARACVAQAQARFSGVGTWESRRAGRIAAEALCFGGTGDACIALVDMTGGDRPVAQGRLLQRALALGASGAAGRLARLAPAGSSRVVALVEACEGGSPEACWALAVEGHNDPATMAARACGLGVEHGCVTSVVLALEEGRVDVAGATAMVDQHCRSDIEEACIAADFYRNGGLPPAFPTGNMGPVQVAMTVDEKIPDLLECYRQQLDAGDTAVNRLKLELATDAAGVFVAVTSRSGSPDAEQCLAGAFLGTPGQRPSGGPARFSASVVLTHEAMIHVEPSGLDHAGRNLGHAEWRYISQLGLDANACYLENGGSAFDRQFAVVKGTLRNTGWYVHDEVVETTGDAATDACLVALLSRMHVPEVDMLDDQNVSIRFVFNRVSRAPRWVGWGHRRLGVPPHDLSRHNHSGERTTSRVHD